MKVRNMKVLIGEMINELLEADSEKVLVFMEKIFRNILEFLANLMCYNN